MEGDKGISVTLNPYIYLFILFYFSTSIVLIDVTQNSLTVKRL